MDHGQSQKEREIQLLKSRIYALFPGLCFAAAKAEDEEAVMGMYRSMIGTAGCTWDMEYPNTENFRRDIASENLFCLKNEAGGLVAVISVDQDEIADALPNWTRTKLPAAELARLAVREDYQNRGLAGRMILAVMEILKYRGYGGVHYLVSRTNLKALAAYEKVSFDYRGEADLYDHGWYCYEKLF